MKPRTRLVFALSASFGAILIAAVLYGIPNFTVHATGQPPAVLDKLKLTQEILLTEDVSSLKRFDLGTGNRRNHSKRAI